MTLISIDTVFVFDLDDTLYKEDDYVKSGITAVAEKVETLYGRNLLPKLLEWKNSGQQDIWKALCEELSIPLAAKEGFIWTYRLHRPNIALSETTKIVLRYVDNNSAGVAILTDGRSITQRLKIAALGLSRRPCYISEEHGSEKPEPRRFELIQAQCPARAYVYIGDNPEKDFKAPNELGWTTIGLRGDGKNIHPQDTVNPNNVYRPAMWISNLDELLHL